MPGSSELQMRNSQKDVVIGSFMADPEWFGGGGVVGMHYITSCVVVRNAWSSKGYYPPFDQFPEKYEKSLKWSRD